MKHPCKRRLMARLALVAALALGLSACASGPGDGGDGAGQVTLLSEPVAGAHVSRGFGMWRHPILGYRRMHRGIDYAVPRGTPVRATGDGVVEMAGWQVGYGRYVRIRHKSGIHTVYAHLSHIADGVHEGAHVAIGMVIGLSGSSGLSTGPHLHYEVWRGDVAINPATLNRQPQIVLRDRQLSAHN
jgi:murein DD-endopeptidase MepM/ murein hydrolase activator NlpD